MIIWIEVVSGLALIAWMIYLAYAGVRDYNSTHDAMNTYLETGEPLSGWHRRFYWADDDE